MQSLTTHYQQPLGLPSTWNVRDIRLAISNKEITIDLEYLGKKTERPVCGNVCSIYDHAPEQKWRHFDTMQFETILVARLPRCNCKEHGVKTVAARCELAWRRSDHAPRGRARPRETNNRLHRTSRPRRKELQGRP